MELDEFSDDGFDDLPDNALQELEQHAIQFTQAQALTQRQIPSQEPQRRCSGYGWEQEDDDLDTTEVINDAGAPVGRPVVDKTLRQQKQPPPPPPQPQPQPQLQRGPQSARASIPPVPNPRWNPTIDPAAGPGASMASRPRISSSRPPSQSFVASQRFPGQTQSIARPQASQFAPPPILSQAQSGAVLSALQQRVRALESELNAARGEASILRAKSTKAQQEYDVQISRLKMQNAEQLSKQERAVEAALAAEKSANTELQFLQRDMKEASDRARRKDPAVAGTAAGATTPKKATKTWGVADGFDEMEIASPSKAQARSKNAGPVALNVGEKTPSKGKRKRPMVDSPVKALETHTVGVDSGEEKLASQPLPVPVEPPTVPPETFFDFLQLVLDHGCSREQPPTFDILSRTSFPSDPRAMSFSTIIFESLPVMGNSHQPRQLLVDFVAHVLGLWTKCVQDAFWEPIKYLASLVSFTFQLDTSFVAPLIVPQLIQAAGPTVFTLADGPRRNDDGTVNSGEHSFLEQHIDIVQILSLLKSAALACATTTYAEDGITYTAAEFWGLMSLDVVLVLLLPKQKVADTMGMLDLLTTSSLPDSIGPIAADKDAASVASTVIERVSAKLTEHLRAAPAPEQKRGLRLAALRTLISFARHPFGASQLASHDNALPRLVICLSTSIDDLYDQPIPPSVLPPLPDCIKSSSLKLPESTAPADLYRIISQCVLLIHTLVTDPCTANLADITRKLSLSHGGSQRYIIALGRLTFAEEDLVMEAGIEGEVVEAAHELLEMAVTPDEGEVVSEAFGA